MEKPPDTSRSQFQEGRPTGREESRPPKYSQDVSSRLVFWSEFRTHCSERRSTRRYIAPSFRRSLRDTKLQIALKRVSNRLPTDFSLAAISDPPSRNLPEFPPAILSAGTTSAISGAISDDTAGPSTNDAADMPQQAKVSPSRHHRLS